MTDRGDALTLQSLYQNTEDVEKMLRRIGVTHWITSGGVLHIHRDNAFSALDPDVDFGVLGGDHWPEIEAEMIGLGFKVARRFGAPDRGHEVAFTGKRTKIDIVSFYDHPERGVMRKCAWGGPNWNQPIPSEYPRELFLDPIEVVFHGVPVYLPNPVEKYLVCQYGSNWRIKDPNWRWWTDPPCIVERIPGWRDQYSKGDPR